MTLGGVRVGTFLGVFPTGKPYKALGTHILRLLGPKTILFRSLGLF